MKIVIDGTDKEIADLVLAIQGQLFKEPKERKTAVLDFIDFLARKAGASIRERRQVKENTTHLATFIQNRLGVNVNSSDIEKYINSGTCA